MTTIQWDQSFTATTALANMYLWLLFGFLTLQVNCDLQRLMQHSVWVRHLVSILAFFFLFTLIDTNNKSNLITTWIKTVVVYILFILTTKSKWFFAIPVLALLLIDQSLKKYVGDLSQQGKGHGEIANQDKINTILRITKVINIIVFVIIIVGAVDYAIRQKREYKGQFSMVKFFLGTTKRCKETLSQIHK